MFLSMCAFLWLLPATAQEFALLKTLQAHTQAITYLQFDQRANQLLSGDASGTILLWDVRSGEVVRRFEGHTGLITDLQFTRDETKFLSASYDGSVRVWEVSTGKSLHHILNSATASYAGVKGNEPTFARFSPDERAVWFGGYNRQILAADLVQGSRPAVLYEEPRFGITSGEFSPDGTFFAFGSGGTVILLDYPSGRLRKMLGTYSNYESSVCEITFHPTDRSLVTWLTGGRIEFWNVEQGRIQQHIQATHELGSSLVAFDATGEAMLTGNLQEKTRIWDTKSRRVVQELGTAGEHSRAVKTFSFSADGRYIATGGDDTRVNIWHKPAPTPVLPPDEVRIAEETPVRPPEKDEFVLEHVHFLQSSSIFLDSAKATAELNHLVAVMKAYPRLVIELQGHTDDQGHSYGNLVLSEQRVEAVKAHVVGQGIDPKRVSTVGFGESRPLVPNITEENRQKNRRVEVKVVKR